MDEFARFRWALPDGAKVRVDQHRDGYVVVVGRHWAKVDAIDVITNPEDAAALVRTRLDEACQRKETGDG